MPPTLYAWIARDRDVLPEVETEAVQLVVKFMLAGDGRLHVEGVARIKVDGRGGLLLYDAQGGTVETIELGALKSIRLQQMRHVYAESAIPVLA